MARTPRKQVDISGQIDMTKLRSKVDGKGNLKFGQTINLTGEGLDQSDSSYTFTFTDISINSALTRIEEFIGNILFTHMPEHYSLTKKLIVSRSITNGWAIYDVVNIILIVYYSISYIIPLYHPSYDLTFFINIVNICVTQIFMFDFLLNCYMGTGLGYWANYGVFPIFELLSMFPGYFKLFYPGTASVVMQYLMSFRIVSIFRIFKHFKYIHNASGLRRQIVYLVLTMMVMIYLATTTVQLLENQSYDCIYINENTGYEPSCVESAPFEPTGTHYWHECLYRSLLLLAYLFPFSHLLVLYSVSIIHRLTPPLSPFSPLFSQPSQTPIVTVVVIIATASMLSGIAEGNLVLSSAHISPFSIHFITLSLLCPPSVMVTSLYEIFTQGQLPSYSSSYL